MPKRIVVSDRLMQPIAHFSHGVRIGATVHLGAAAGVDAARRLAGTTPGLGDMPAQTEQLFANLRIALEALGGSWTDVVRVKTYIVDWRDLPAYEAVYAARMGATRPAAATVGTWGFPLPQILLETELVACPGGSGGRADGLYYRNAAPIDGGGAVAAPRDARAQAEVAIRNLAAVLEEAGLGLEHVVMLEVSLADIRVLEAFDAVFARFFRPPFPARSVVGVPLSRAGQLVELEAIAATGGEPIEPAGAVPPAMAVSAMRAGDWFFASARSGAEEPGAEAQTRRAWERIAASLDAAGMALEDVVRTNNILTDWRAYAAFNAGYGAFVTRPYPPRATVHAALAAPGACVQVQAIAHRQGRDATVLEADRNRAGAT
ncbi:MAG TPA: RidA family protein [Burkholderiales bacterium]|nr:RidA family protein [Burkholderiales bacterium]